MSNIINMSVLTMSSQEIADLVESRHDSVKRTIERLASQGIIASPPLVEKPSTGGRPGTEYVFSGNKGKRDSIIVVAQLSPEFTARLVDRWQELEGIQTAPAIPQSLPEALRLAAEAIEDRDRLALENKVKDEALAIAAPKVRALDRIASPTEGSVCLRIAAKLLQMPERQFFQFANAEGYIFRHHHSRVWQGYAEKSKAGLVEQKFTTIERDDGSTKVVEQVLITRLGIAKLAEKLEMKKLCMTTMMPTELTAGQSRRSSMQP
jgi:phage antirepressor YoqD-like protein